MTSWRFFDSFLFFLNSRLEELFVEQADIHLNMNLKSASNIFDIRMGAKMTSVFTDIQLIFLQIIQFH